jgi:hypothetical protein
VLPEAPAAPDDVLPQARLALVDACRRALGQRRALDRTVDALLVHGVSRFVHRAEEAVAQIVLVEAGGDAHIAQREAGHEGVVRLVLASALEVIAKLANDRLRRMPTAAPRDKDGAGRSRRWAAVR